RAGGQAQEFGGFLGAKKAWGDSGQVGSHRAGLRGVPGGRWFSAANGDHGGEDCWRGGGGSWVTLILTPRAGGSRPAAMAKKSTIPAGDHRQPVLDQGGGGVAQRRCLP